MKFIDLYNKRLTEIAKDTNKNKVSANSGRAVIGIIPVVLFFTIFEYLWYKIRGRDIRIPILSSYPHITLHNQNLWDDRFPGNLSYSI